MDLVIDLEKSRQGLVLRKVPVTLPSGKQGFANRWVQPNKKDGESKVSTSKQENTTESNKNSISPFSEDITKIDSVPIAEENVDGSWKGMDGTTYNSEMDALIGQYIGPEIYQSNSTKEWHIDGSDESFGTEKQAYRKAHELVQEKAKTSKPKASQEISRKPVSQALMEGVSDIVKEYMSFTDFDNDDITSWYDLEELSEDMLDFYATEINDQVKKNLPNNGTFSDVVQRRVYESGFGRNLNAFAVIGSDPTILKTTLKGILGEELYGTMKGHTKNSTLSINLKESTMDKYVIPDGGYRGHTPELKLRKAIGEEAVERYHSIIENIDDSQPWLDVVTKLTDGYKNIPGLSDVEKKVAQGISKRTRYEHTNIGIHLKDPKPVYIAYNVGNSPHGGQDYYGDTWMEISPEILSQCTVSKVDSYFGGDIVTHAQSMDHLGDLSILKALDGDYPLSKREIMRGDGMDRDLGVPVWAAEPYHEGDVALELHYHQPILTLDKIKKYHK